MQHVLLYGAMGAWLAVILVGYPLTLVVTARRPADDRDAFIRKLPPPSHLLSVREAHLRLLVRQELIKQVKIEAVLAGVLAGVLAVLGLSSAASDRAPIGVGIAATAYVAVPMMVLYALFTGPYLFARYRSAQLRMHNDAQWHASGEQQPALPTDA
jgi:hypothetical protein